MFQRLNNHQFWKKSNRILVEITRVPTRATHPFLRRLTEATWPLASCFVGCHSYGFANLCRSLKEGSGNAEHINPFFCVPQARFPAVTPRDIHYDGLEDAARPLVPMDVKRAKDGFWNAPFFAPSPERIAVIEQLLAMGVRAKQQALPKWGLNIVMDEFIPRKARGQCEISAVEHVLFLRAPSREGTSGRDAILPPPTSRRYSPRWMRWRTGAIIISGM
jgi:DNA topoisomerase VI subunit A